MSRAWKPAAALTVATLGWAVSLWSAGPASAYYSVTPVCTVGGASAPCASGWYTSAVWLGWTWAPSTGNPASGCMTWSFTSDVQTSVSCTVQGPDGTSTVTQNVNVEVSSPSAYGLATRPPDAHGWYNHPLAVTFRGAAFSGIQSCTTTTYAGRAAATATASGSCTDNAGKVALASFNFRYDATPPSVRLLPGRGDRLVTLRWAAADVAPISRVKITRAPGLHGQRSSVIYSGAAAAVADHRVSDGVRYRYSVSVTDRAGNTSTRSVSVIPDPHLLSPAPGARLGRPPLLSWTPVAGASYYNVQLFLGGKVLSTWPRIPRLALSRTWRFDGRRYHLKPGRYHWYVWPGFGSLAAAIYGRLIGSATFIIT